MDIAKQRDRFLAQAHQDGVKRFCVGAGLLWKGQLLLVKRADTDHFLAGYYELPGGSVEPGETLHEALIREVDEETGLTFEQITNAGWTFDFIAHGEHVRQIQFVGTSISNTVRLSEEHSAFCWIGREEALPEPMSPEMKLTIEHIRTDCMR